MCAYGYKLGLHYCTEYLQNIPKGRLEIYHKQKN